MTSRQILIGLPHVGQPVDLGDRNLEAARIDQTGQFREHLGIRGRAVAFGLDAVFRGRREVDDRIDPIRRDTEFERQMSPPNVSMKASTLPPDAARIRSATPSP